MKEFSSWSGFVEAPFTMSRDMSDAKATLGTEVNTN